MTTPVLPETPVTVTVVPLTETVATPVSLETADTVPEPPLTAIVAEELPVTVFVSVMPAAFAVTGRSVMSMHSTAKKLISLFFMFSPFLPEMIRLLNGSKLPHFLF